MLVVIPDTETESGANSRWRTSPSGPSDPSSRNSSSPTRWPRTRELTEDLIPFMQGAVFACGKIPAGRAIAGACRRAAIRRWSPGLSHPDLFSAIGAFQSAW